MYLRKDQGGCEITHRGTVYAWANDGDITEVPDDLAMEIVPHGGFRVVPPPAPEDGDGEPGKPARATRKPAADPAA